MKELIAVLVSILATSASLAQSGVPMPTDQSAVVVDGSIEANTYGTTDQTAYTVGAFDFNPRSSTSTFAALIGTGDRYFTSVGGFFTAPVNLPAGAIVEAIEIQGCDTNAVSDITATLLSGSATGGTVHGFITTSGAPGCGYFQASLPTPPTIENRFENYSIQVTHGATDGTNRFGAVRLFYRLEVSPPPFIPTFTDVPITHPFFRFIEALAASGITSGCGNGAYCPDAPVTRGQMAVFLSAALGLHWAP